MSEAAPALCDGRYRLISELGAGGMATVYRAYDSRLQVERAIKVLSPALTRSKRLRARFEVEARTMARLSHRNILKVFDVAEDAVLRADQVGSVRGSITSYAISETVLQVRASTFDPVVAQRLATATIDQFIQFKSIKNPCP